MNGGFVRHKELVIVTFGASVIGAVGILLYNQYLDKRKLQLVQKEIQLLDSSVSELRRDLEAVRFTMERDNQLSGQNTRQVIGAPSVTTDAETEMFSTMGGDDLYDEFYELSSENEIAVEEHNEIAFEELDALLDGNSKEGKIKSYGVLLEMFEKGDNNDEVLWRLAKACHMMSSIYNAEGDNIKTKEFILKGADFGEKAVKFNNSSWKAHKWFAICIGKRGQLKGVKEKLSDGHLFKEHVDKALEINSEDALLHHLLGRFYYEIATLSWFEKKVANTLFGEVPQGSYKDAINSLLKAEELNSTPWKDNRLLIAKCYGALQDYKSTLKWLDSAKEVSVNNNEDKIAENELNELLKKFNAYRNLKL